MALIKLPNEVTGMTERVEEHKKDEKELNEQLDLVLDNNETALDFSSKDKEIIQSIIDADSKAELEKQFALFNINQSKKNALRIIKLEQIMNIAEDQAIDRLTKRPDQISHRELLDYMQIISGQIDRSQKYIDTLPERDLIQPVNVDKQQININIGTDYTQDNKENVINAVKGIFDIIKQNNAKQAKNDVIDTPITDLSDKNEEEDDLYQPITIKPNDENQ